MLLALTMTLGAVAQTSPFKYVDAEALPTAADGVQIFSFNENMLDMIPMESITKMIKKDGNSSVMANVKTLLKKLKSLVQCFWVLFFFAVGELIGMMIGHFLPGSVIGLILLFLALETKLIKPDKVDSVAKFLTLNMGLFFVPAGVGLITQVELIQQYWAAIIISMVVSTALVLVVVGRMQHRFERHHKEQKTNDNA